MLSANDPLPFRPKRVLITGVTGVGKTTLASRLSEMLALPYTELDSLFHGENWTPREEFVDEVMTFANQDAWITEWQYRLVRWPLAERADLMIWLDFSFLRVNFPRLLRRTVRRSVLKEELWHGNVEGPLRTIFTNRDHILRWGWRTRAKYKTMAPEADENYEQLTIVRLRSPKQLERWISQVLIPNAQ